MRAGWGREELPDLAVEKILAAAEKAFIEFGVSAAGMSAIAETAGCSRGTLYRYFPTRHDLHLAYVNREALRIVARVQKAVAGVRDPRRRVVETLLLSVREVRRNPATAAWFEPGASGIAARMSRSSEVIERLTEGFVSELGGAADGLEARWLVRVIVSLLAMPGANEAEERALVERFVAPALAGSAAQRRAGRRPA